MGGAKLTGINLTTSDTVVSSNLLALLAEDTLRPTSFFEKVKAVIIGRKLLCKIFNSVGLHFFSPISFYTYIISQNICAVKG
jgi:hypothetical protein